MATRQQSDKGWLIIVLLLLGAIAVLLAIDAVADGIRNVLLEIGVPMAIAGNIGAVIFGMLVLLMFALVLKARQ
jgi:hypothetical protein